jgi:cytochrome d ubiquinol oxidase subunit I
MISHHMLVPLYIGTMCVAAVLETLYVATNNTTCKNATKFIVLLCFPVLIAVVITGVMTPPFGSDWSRYYEFVMAVDGGLTATFGLTAFTVIPICYILFFAGWERLPRWLHLLITWLIPFICIYGESPAIFINGWMQDPMASSTYDPETFLLGLTSFEEYALAPMTALRFLHNFTGNFLIGAVSVIAIGCYYLKKGENIAFAKKSILAASVLGLTFSFVAILSGDKHGKAVHQSQPMKLAQLEAIWETEPAPADLVLFAIPDQQAQENHLEIKIPAVLGWLLGDSEASPVLGIKALRESNEERIRNGLAAYQAMQALKAMQPNTDDRLLETFRAHQADLGYARLLEKYTDDVLQASNAQIGMAADDTVGNVALLFFSFRIMVGIGLFLLGFFAFWFYKSCSNTIERTKTSTLLLSILALPLPFIAYTCGWVLSESGRQPWVIYGVLPTAAGTGEFTGGATAGFQLSTMLVAYPVIFVIVFLVCARLLKQGPDQRYRGTDL